MEIPIEIFFLVLASSLFHACWNFAARKVKGNIVVVWLGVFTGFLFVLPFVFLFNFQFPQVFNSQWDTHAVPFIILTGIAHGFYYLMLAFSYHSGEISVVYPIARGTGVGMTSILAYFVLHEPISIIGFVGIWSIVIGVLMLGLSSQFPPLPFKRFFKSKKLELVELPDIECPPEACSLETSKEGLIPAEDKVPAVEKDPAKPDRSSTLKTLALAFAVGVCITSYSITDKLGVSKIDPVTYIAFIFGQTSLYLFPYIMWQHREECKYSLKEHKKYIFLIGPMAVVSYIAILYAFQRASASYVVAIREMSVVFGSILGFLLLKEPFTWPKAVGIATITIGLVLVKVA